MGDVAYEFEHGGWQGADPNRLNSSNGVDQVARDAAASNATKLQAMLASAPDALDTFLEAWQRFQADEAAYVLKSALSAQPVMLAGGYSGAPTAAIGLPGDFYPDFSTLATNGCITLYGPKQVDNTTWPTKTTQIRGPGSWIQPADLGYKAVSIDPRGIGSGMTPVAGAVYTVRLAHKAAIAVGDIVKTTTYLFAAGTGATALAGCYLGLYDASSKAQIAVSTDRAADWATAYRKDISLTATAAKADGTDLIAAFLVATQSTTPVQIARGGGNLSADLTNGMLASSNPLFGSADTGRTTLPATLGAITAQPNQIYIGTF